MPQIDLPQSACRFAIARADITPPVGMYHRMWGAAKHDRSTGVHRPLLATVAMFQSPDGQSTQTLVALDHCLLGRPEMENLLAAIAQAGVDPGSVAVTFSHTHAAGLMTLDRQSLPGGEALPEYLRQMNDTTAALARECSQSLRETTITYAAGKCNLAAHRDFWDEARQQYVCGFNPGADADDAVLTAKVVDADGRTLATFVNYACHPTTLAWDNTLVSPDYPGAMREVVEQATGGAPCMFLQGASGDLGPRHGFVGDVAVADANGRQLGYAALSALESSPPASACYHYDGPVASGATIGVWSYKPLSADERRRLSTWQVKRLTLDLPYRDDLPTVDETRSARESWLAKEQSARQQGDESAAAECRAMAERSTRMLARLSNLSTSGAYPYEIVLWRMGDAAWVSVQGEPYNVLQTALRARFPQTPIMVASISSHWSAAYLPPKDLYGSGIYQETVAVLAPGSLERVTEAIERELVAFGFS